MRNHRVGLSALAATVAMGAVGCGQAPTASGPTSGSPAGLQDPGQVQATSQLQADYQVQQYRRFTDDRRRRFTDRRGGRYWWRNRWVTWNPYVLYYGPFDYFQPYYGGYGWYYYRGQRYWGQYRNRDRDTDRRDTDRRRV